ncbi:hypothetical protein [Chengkuizengella axinellae]|uniref:Uncharacterized protein n=1 Tax=Chengkuizengella axinellae TaxID=3064388 RepID=A0ABT9IYG9_9BACL|nr:hypothetical protein [Chengkuizengella sp. 2205SS18-9]MDP5274355.1 hypothetical protein [Chengkuizengella sp. 2205SS18-9]
MIDLHHILLHLEKQEAVNTMKQIKINSIPYMEKQNAERFIQSLNETAGINEIEEQQDFDRSAFDRFKQKFGGG